MDGNLISPAMYREFILPYERMLADFYHGISYYHSCGNMSHFFADLSQIPNFGKIHVSHASDLKQAIIHSGFRTYEQSLNPYADLLDATSEHITRRFMSLRETYSRPNFEIWADAVYVGGQDTVDKAVNLVNIFRTIFH